MRDRTLPGAIRNRLAASIELSPEITTSSIAARSPSEITPFAHHACSKVSGFTAAIGFNSSTSSGNTQQTANSPSHLMRRDARRTRETNWFRAIT